MTISEDDKFSESIANALLSRRLCEIPCEIDNGRQPSFCCFECPFKDQREDCDASRCSHGEQTHYDHDYKECSLYMS